MEDFEPSYSPDGRRVVLVSDRPRWSPDGRRIVYDAAGPDNIRDLWTIDVAGGAPRRLTSGPMTNSLSCGSRSARLGFCFLPL